MGPVVLDLLGILEDNSIGVIGTDIFGDKEPEKPDDCITIYVYNSIPTNCFVGLEPERYNFQVRVRSKVFVDGHNTMDAIRALIAKQTFTLGSPQNTEMKIGETSLPLNLQQDAKNRHILVMNFNLLRYTV